MNSSCELAQAVTEEITSYDDPQSFIRTLDDMYDAYITSIIKDSCTNNDAIEVVHYRRLRQFFERIGQNVTRDA